MGCEDKTVFEITGFHLSGHTHHAASAMATKGIRVSLLSTDNHVLKSVETDENGDYNFENVPSGEYVLKAEHSSWVLAEPSTQMITVLHIHSFSPAGWIWQREGEYRFRGDGLQDRGRGGEPEWLSRHHRRPDADQLRQWCMSLLLLTRSGAGLRLHRLHRGRGGRRQLRVPQPAERRIHAGCRFSLPSP